MRGQRGAGRRRGRWRWRDRDRAVGKEEEREGARREKEGGKEGEGKRKSENTETEEKTGERLDGKKPEGLQAGVDSRLGRAGLDLGDVSTGSAPCTVWAAGSGCTSQADRSPPLWEICQCAPAHPPHLDYALAYHLALRVSTVHAPSECAEMSPSPPSSQAPASLMPPPQETRRAH